MSIRHVVPVPRRSATGRVAEVYAQSTADFGQAAFMMLSPAPELHAAAWAMLRESELAGLARRTDKEVVAVAVSQANRCRFCVDAHTILIHALGEHQLAEDLLNDRVPTNPHHAALATWAKATRTLDPAHLAAPPFQPELAAEYIGTALSTHFINRMFSTLTDEQLLPGNLQRARSVRRRRRHAPERAKPEPSPSHGRRTHRHRPAFAWHVADTTLDPASRSRPTRRQTRATGRSQTT